VRGRDVGNPGSGGGSDKKESENRRIGESEQLNYELEIEISWSSRYSLGFVGVFTMSNDVARLSCPPTCPS
jgi:hypothetical protein